MNVVNRLSHVVPSHFQESKASRQNAQRLPSAVNLDVADSDVVCVIDRPKDCAGLVLRGHTEESSLRAGWEAFGSESLVVDARRVKMQD